MAHFAEVDQTGAVLRVIVAEQDYIDSGEVDEAGYTWVKTSYNTNGGKHIDPPTKQVNTKTPLRGNFSGAGYKYDQLLDAFIPPQPYASWKLNKTSFMWEAPVAQPNDGAVYAWNEGLQRWEEVV